MSRSKVLRGFTGLVLGIALQLTGDVQGQIEPRLTLQGSPYFGGDMTLTLEEPQAIAEFAWVALGIDPAPLLSLAPTAIGPWAIGSLLRVLPAGFVPVSGRLDAPFNVGPEIPSIIGVHLVVHGYVGERLSNPATLPFDLPYYETAHAVELTSPMPAAGVLFGNRVEAADLDGNGFSDIIVGAWWEDIGAATNAGRAYVFWGPDFTSTTTLTPPNPITFGEFGGGLACGDIDGDGQVDLVVTENPGEPPIPLSAAGHVYVYFGGDSFTAAPTFSVPTLGSGPAYGQANWTVTIGDLNADTFDDVAMGAANHAVGGSDNVGKVDVLWGPTLLTGVEIFDPTPTVNAFFGDRIHTGDIDGNGTDDLVVSMARKEVEGVYGTGEVHIFKGPSLAHSQLVENPLPQGINTRFGNATDIRDMQGDGLPDLVVTNQKDQVFIFWGPSFAQYYVIDRPPSVYATLENSVSYGYRMLTGDVNGDGWADVIVNDPFSGPVTSCSFGAGGAVLVALGPYFATHHVLFDPTPECLTEYGWSMVLDDLNNDGRLDLIAGNDLADANGLNGSGKVVIRGLP